MPLGKLVVILATFGTMAPPTYRFGFGSVPLPQARGQTPPSNPNPRRGASPASANGIAAATTQIGIRFGNGGEKIAQQYPNLWQLGQDSQREAPPTKCGGSGAVGRTENLGRGTASAEDRAMNALGMFPYTRWLQLVVISLLPPPLKMLGVGIASYVIYRVTCGIIERAPLWKQQL